MQKGAIECIKQLKKSVGEHGLIVDIFLSGSVSRKEERTFKNKVTSDVDLIIITRNADELYKTKSILENIREEYKKIANVSLIYCLLDRFTKSELADYVLSVDFQNPIIKKIDYKYIDSKNEELNEKRWIYQMQSTVFYFCKYMISFKAVFICKAFHCLLRTNIYKEKKVENNSYILIDNLKEYIDENLYEMLLQSRNHLLNMQTMDENIVNQIVNYVNDGIMEKYNNDKCNVMGKTLHSLKCFGQQINENLGLVFENKGYYKTMREVMNENLGIDDISIIDYD